MMKIVRIFVVVVVVLCVRRSDGRGVNFNDIIGDSDDDVLISVMSGDDVHKEVDIDISQHILSVMKVNVEKLPKARRTTRLFNAYALHLAAMIGRVRLVKHIIKLGGSMNVGATIDGFFDEFEDVTPAWMAVLFNRTEVVRVLLERGANVCDGPTDSSYTTLNVAVDRGYSDLVTVLLHGGCVPQLSTGTSSLHTAVANGHLELVKVFATHYPQLINEQAYRGDGDSPLHTAAHKNFADIVEYLLSVGANPTLKTAADETPLDLARKSGANECVAILEEWGKQTKNRDL